MDLLVGETLARPHPVALAGRALDLWEQRCYRNSYVAGLWYVVGGLFLGELSSIAIPSVGVMTYVTVSQHMLVAEARTVARLLRDRDIGRARIRLRSLVGRDTSELDESEIARAAIESVAENTIDGVVAPLLWAAIGGVRGASYYRMINTMDSQVGYRSDRYRRFGMIAARLDDLANYPAARLGALLVALLRPRQAARIVATVRRDAPAHPSPNGGVIEAAFAAALRVRLGGTNVYGGVREERGSLGDGASPTVASIEAACRLSQAVGLATLGAIVAWERWRRRDG
jgi:adenosylcobinamide-phosphate synthase